MANTMVQGEILKAEREIMRNDSGTGGDSWYYSVTEFLRAGDIALKAGEIRSKDQSLVHSREGSGNFCIFTDLQAFRH